MMGALYEELIKYLSILFPDSKKLFDAPDQPTDTMGALQQRLKKYQDSEAEAKEQGNSSKARRMGRIAKVDKRTNHGHRSIGYNVFHPS